MKNYLYLSAPDIQPSEYENMKKKYLELEENYHDRQSFFYENDKLYPKKMTGIQNNNM